MSRMLIISAGLMQHVRFEHCFQNVLSVYISAWLCMGHLAEVALWYNLVSLNTCGTHSGYIQPLTFNASHDRHHQNFRKNFGAVGLMDRLHGTYDDGSASKTH